MIVSAVAVQPEGQLVSVHVCTGGLPGFWKSTTTFPWSSVTCRPKSTETDVLDWPLTVITLLDPGFETMRSDWPSQMIVNETVKWFVGSAPAPGG